MILNFLLSFLHALIILQKKQSICKKKKNPSSPSLWISKKLKPAAVHEPKIKPVAGGTLDVCLIAV